jgi:hypothetical protein
MMLNLYQYGLQCYSPNMAELKRKKRKTRMWNNASSYLHGFAAIVEGNRMRYICVERYRANRCRSVATPHPMIEISIEQNVCRLTPSSAHALVTLSAASYESHRNGEPDTKAGTDPDG